MRSTVFGNLCSGNITWDLLIKRATVNRLLYFSFFHIPTLFACHLPTKKSQIGRKKQIFCFFFVLFFFLDTAESILLYFGPRRSVVCSSQPHRPTGVGKRKKKTHHTPQSRCPNIDISRLHSLRKSGGQDEKQRYGIEDNLHLGDRDRELCVCVIFFFFFFTLRKENR